MNRQCAMINALKICIQLFFIAKEDLFRRITCTDENKICLIVFFDIVYLQILIKIPS